MGSFSGNDVLSSGALSRDSAWYGEDRNSCFLPKSRSGHSSDSARRCAARRMGRGRLKGGDGGAWLHIVHSVKHGFEGCACARVLLKASAHEVDFHGNLGSLLE